MVSGVLVSAEYTDAETGFVYLRARYYDPATGQFINRDPLEALTQEPYGYVGGNPLNTVDPSGLAPFDSVKDFASDRINDAVITARLAASYAVAKGVGPALSGVNFVNEHAGFSAMICVYVCVGLEVNKGSLYLNYGAGELYGAAASFNYYSHSLEKWGCEGTAPSQLSVVGHIVEVRT